MKYSIVFVASWAGLAFAGAINGRQTTGRQGVAFLLGDATEETMKIFNELEKAGDMTRLSCIKTDPAKCDASVTAAALDKLKKAPGVTITSGGSGATPPKSSSPPVQKPKPSAKPGSSSGSGSGFDPRKAENELCAPNGGALNKYGVPAGDCRRQVAQCVFEDSKKAAGQRSKSFDDIVKCVDQKLQ